MVHCWLYHIVPTITIIILQWYLLLVRMREYLYLKS